MSEARCRVGQAATESGFPIVLNERVLKQLNCYAATPDSHNFVRSAVDRMERLRPMLECKRAEYEAPAELMEVGIVESGFRDLPPVANPRRGDGIWQFIASTARAYSLRVDEEADERLHVETLADAAMRYLTGAQQRFQVGI